MVSVGIESHGSSVGSSSVCVIFCDSMVSWLWTVDGLSTPRSASGPSLLVKSSPGDVVVDLDEV